MHNPTELFKVGRQCCFICAPKISSFWLTNFCKEPHQINRNEHIHGWESWFESPKTFIFATHNLLNFHKISAFDWAILVNNYVKWTKLSAFMGTDSFWPIGLIFCGHSGNYYLWIVSVKSMLWHLISDFNFWGPFWQENRHGCHAAPKGLGPQNPTKKLAHAGVLLSHLLSYNPAPKLSDPGPP